MNITLIQSKVLRLISDQSGLNVDDIKEQKLTTIDDFNFDSLDVIELVMAIEEEFDLEIPDAHAERFNDISDVVTYVNSET